MMMIKMVVEAMVMIKCFRLGKEERGKQNELKEKVKFIGPFCFGDQDT